MMRVVVIDADSLHFSFFLPTPVHTRELFNSCLHFHKRDAELQTNRDRSQGILNIVVAGNLQRHLAEVVESMRDRKCARIFFMNDTDRLDIRLRSQSVREQFLFAELRHDVLKRRFIETQHDEAIKGHFVRELNECPFDVLKVAVTIEMVGLERRQHCNRRRDRKKRTVKFVCFHDDKVAFAEACVCAAEAAQFSSHNHGRIKPPLHEDKAHHRCRRRLAVCPRDADAVFQAHHFCKHLSAAHNRNFPALRFKHFRIFKHHRR